MPVSIATSLWKTSDIVVFRPMNNMSLASHGRPLGSSLVEFCCFMNNVMSTCLLSRAVHTCDLDRQNVEFLYDDSVGCDLKEPVRLKISWCPGRNCVD